MTFDRNNLDVLLKKSFKNFCEPLKKLLCEILMVKFYTSLTRKNKDN